MSTKVQRAWQPGFRMKPLEDREYLRRTPPLEGTPTEGSWVLERYTILGWRAVNIYDVPFAWRQKNMDLESVMLLMRHVNNKCSKGGTFRAVNRQTGDVIMADVLG